MSISVQPHEIQFVGGGGTEGWERGVGTHSDNGRQCSKVQRGAITNTVRYMSFDDQKRTGRSLIEYTALHQDCLFKQSLAFTDPPDARRPAFLLSSCGGWLLEGERKGKDSVFGGGGNGTLYFSFDNQLHLSSISIKSPSRKIGKRGAGSCSRNHNSCLQEKLDWSRAVWVTEKRDTDKKDIL